MYLVTEGGGGGDVNAKRRAVGSREAFTIVKTGSHHAAIRTNNGRFLSAHGGGNQRVYAYASAINAWENWHIQVYR